MVGTRQRFSTFTQFQRRITPMFPTLRIDAKSGGNLVPCIDRQTPLATRVWLATSRMRCQFRIRPSY